jgi:hypothetical protein
MVHRVAIIGNGPSVLEHRWGAQIDACDEVVRINAYRLADAEHDWRPHVGEKLTVWTTYQSPQEHAVPHEVWWVEFDYIRLQEERDVMLPWCIKHGVVFTWVPGEAVERAFAELDITHRERHRPNNAGLKPSSGIVAIEYARMRWPESELYVAGFDGFLVGSPGYYWTGDILHPSHIRKHFPDRQRAYVARLLRDGIVREFTP